MSLKAPNAWRGLAAEGRTDVDVTASHDGRRDGHVGGAGREVASRRAEAVALAAMGVATTWLLSRKEWPKSWLANLCRRRSSRLASVCLVAAACIMLIAGCGLLPTPTVAVAPDPANFGRTYGDDLVTAGETLARKRCMACHRVSGRFGRGGAPPLDTLIARWGSNRLNDELVAGLSVNHGGMPRFDFNVTAASALIAYLEDIAS